MKDKRVKGKYVVIDNEIMMIYYSEITKRYYIDYETTVDRKLVECAPVVSGETLDELSQNIAKKCSDQRLSYSGIKTA